MTDDRAARLAALRASRAQTATPAPIAAAPVGSAPASVRARPSRPQQRVAAGARIVVTGLAASGVFGLTTVIAAANQPTPVAEQPTWSVANTPVATTPVIDPAVMPVNTLAVTPGVDPTVAGVQSIVLTIPPLATTAPPVGASPADAALAPRPAPAPNPAAAPAPTAAITPPPTVAPTAPPTTACTTNASGKCK